MNKLKVPGLTLFNNFLGFLATPACLGGVQALGFL